MLLLSGIVDARGGTTVRVDDFGAVGDGLTDDALAINDAIEAAGVGGTVAFTAGKTYLICSSLFLRDGQTWLGNGAVLKRCGAVRTTLLEPVAADATEIRVADPLGYRVGMYITPVRGSGDGHGQADGEQNTLHEITDIDGDRLTFTNGLRQSYETGDQVITAFSMVLNTSAAHSGIVITGLVFDGNLTANQVYFTWKDHVSLILRGSGNTVQGNTFTGCHNDCLRAATLSDTLITGNTFRDAGGSAVHLSGAVDIEFIDNHIENVGLYASESQHTEAAFTYSTQSFDILVRNNTFMDLPRYAVGNMNQATNAGLTIEENLICNSGGFFAVILRSPRTHLSDAGVIVRDNIAINAGNSKMLASESLLLEDLEITGNRIVNGWLEMERVDDVLIGDNFFDMQDPETYGDPDSSDDTRHGIIGMIGCSDVLVSGNTLLGNDKGITIFNYTDRQTASVDVTGNALIDQASSAIQVGTAAAVEDPGTLGDYDVAIDDNGIIGGTFGLGALSKLARGVAFSGNRIDAAGDGLQLYGRSSTTGMPSATIAGNEIATAGEAMIYGNDALLADLTIIDNQMTKMLDPIFTAAEGAVVSGNTVVGDMSIAIDPEDPSVSLFLQQPVGEDLCSSEDYTMSVTTRWEDHVTVQWLKDGVVLPGEMARTLMLGPLDLGDTGFYAAMATGDCYAELSMPASVTVSDLMMIPRPRVVAQGLGANDMAVELMCGDDIIDIVWTETATETVLGTGTSVSLPRFDQTTEILVEATDGIGTWLELVYVLVSPNDLFYDLNGDGCNTVEDVHEVASSWRSAFPDNPSGGSVLNLLDLLYISTHDEECTSRGAP